MNQAGSSGGAPLSVLVPVLAGMGWLLTDGCFGVRRVGRAAIFSSFFWVVAAVSPTRDRVLFWLQGTRWWLCSMGPALAAKQDCMGSWWMGVWDWVSSVLWSFGLNRLATNFDRLGWCLVIDLKVGGWWFGGWIWVWV